MAFGRPRGVHQLAIGGLMDGIGSRGGNTAPQNACTTFAFRHECCPRGDLMFLACVISNSCAWQK
jgi:hypothetical protein